MTESDIDTMAHGYIVCALFTAPEEIVTPRSGEFDPHPHMGRVSAAERARILDLCQDFYTRNAADLADYPPDCAGHDLAYTRNGYGVGFWEADHCTKEQGKRLTDSARALGESEVWRDRGGWFRFLDC